MNAFYEHHKDNIRFAYRCFDRILLHAAIQPFQQEQRAVGFFWTYRQIYPVSRQLLRDIATQYHNWVKNRSLKWGVPIQEDPPGRRRFESRLTRTGTTHYEKRILVRDPIMGLIL